MEKKGKKEKNYFNTEHILNFFFSFVKHIEIF